MATARQLAGITLLALAAAGAVYAARSSRGSAGAHLAQSGARGADIGGNRGVPDAGFSGLARRVVGGAVDLARSVGDIVSDRLAKVRGIRNNNPGNIRLGAPWRGAVGAVEQFDADTGDQSFVKFTEPKWGLRAMARTLRTYSRRGVRTVESIISRWAPSNENDTDSYIDSITRRLGVARDAVIDVSNDELLAKLMDGIITHENGGNPYSAEQLHEGIRLERTV